MDPSALFEVSCKQAFLTGVALALLAGNIGPVFLDGYFVLEVASGVLAALASENLLPFALLSALEFPLALVAILILTRWVGDTLGTQILRSAVADLAGASSANWGYWRLWAKALCFVLGIESGLLLTPLRFFGWNNTVLIWLLAVTVFIWIWLVKIRAAGRLVLGSCRNPPPRLLLSTLSYWAAVQLGLFTWPVLFSRLAIGKSDLSGMFSLAADSESPLDLNFLLEAASIVTLFGGLILSSLINITGLGILVLWLYGRRQPKCHVCEEPALHWRMVGRQCKGCGEPQAPWIYLQAMTAPATDRVTSVHED